MIKAEEAHENLCCALNAVEDTRVLLRGEPGIADIKALLESCHTVLRDAADEVWVLIPAESKP